MAAAACSRIDRKLRDPELDRLSERHSRQADILRTGVVQANGGGMGRDGSVREGRLVGTLRNGEDDAAVPGVEIEPDEGVRLRDELIAVAE